MADSGVPFALDAANAVLVEDLTDLPPSLPTTVDVLMTDLVAGDTVGQMVFVAKLLPTNSNIDPTTITVTITPTDTSAGVIEDTSDPTIVRGLVQLTADQVDQIATAETYTYSVVATVTRSGVGTSARMVQRGGIGVITDA